MDYLIYLILKSVIYAGSVLPFWVLHGLSNFLYWNVYYVFDYRKKVVRSNLKNSFPEKTEGELKAIEKKFYKHLCDIMVESLKSFTISEKEIKKRHKFINPEVAQKYIDEGYNISFIAPHYNNWEWFIMSLNFIKEPVNPKVLVMYAVLKNPYMEKLIKKSRSRMGTIMFPKAETMRQIVNYKNEQHFLCFAADQAPHNPYNSYWMEFLGQETAVFFGAEKLTKAKGYIPIYMRAQKKARSYYEIELEVITDKPQATEHGYITEKFMKLLENDLHKEPAYWLWSHKRWKKKKPADFEEKRNSVSQD
ncbi:lysophospholipid acyltransferase family protein [Marivirga sp. S37H4]|uniref:Lysophospholipid acyltransferase family protein n=1 Tax=Marivirga aurantiaca TaxID=2802615 RepID=A0A934WZT7_9BACT|nr:lysophospholipid acyltransferase family protein [Marivirga aurantiaca]MBK6265907.1 lysophospholipid acyltransferase family protein [Marivirga aurantiaca]